MRSDHLQLKQWRGGLGLVRGWLFLGCLLLGTALASTALAQDAGSVLRLSVGFRTLKNTAQVDEATKQKVAELEKLAVAANGESKYGDALKHYSHAMALLRKMEWTPKRAFDTALQAKLDKVVYDPGEAVRITLTQSFVIDEPLAATQAEVRYALKQMRGTELVTVKELAKVATGDANSSSTKLLGRQAGVLQQHESRLPQVPDGSYQLTMTIAGTEGEILTKSAPLRIERDLTAQFKLLKSRANEMRAEFANRSQTKHARATAGAEYIAALLDLVNSGQLPFTAYNLKEKVADAHAQLDIVARGDHPNQGKRGDIHWAYRSAVDNTPQPYRLFVPAKYVESTKWPLVVALHGMGGDENSFFNSYNKGAIKDEAEKRGYLMVCPKGRGPADMYMGNAQRDVFDVIAEVRRDYNIDADRIYIMGHSMGGYGSWSTAVAQPDLFAAIAPIAGGGMPQVYMNLAKIKHIPWLVVHGDKDPTVNVEESRRLVKAGKELGIEIKYLEIPGGDHSNIALPAFKDIFDWFDAHKRQPSQAAKAAAGNG